MAEASEPGYLNSDMTDDRPIALRRKRRASLVHSNNSHYEIRHEVMAAEKTEQRREPKTPGRPKRVRFSFPPDTSTGLTQHVARTRLYDNDSMSRSLGPQLYTRGPRRRRTVSVGPTERTSLSLDSIELQFKPIRQILSERTRRRLTRNRLSETMNEIEAEKKSHVAVCQELVSVKRELEDLVSERARSDSETSRLHELETEVQTLRHQLDDPQLTSHGRSPVHDSPEEIDLIASDDPCSFGGSELSSNLCMTPGDSSPATPTTPITAYESRPGSVGTAKGVSTGSQTEIASVDIQDIQQHLQTQAEHISVARLELERLIPGETPLPLRSPTKWLQGSIRRPVSTMVEDSNSSESLPLVDVQPLISVLFEHLQSMSDRATKAVQALTSAEGQKASLRGHFRAALHQLDEMRAAHAALLAETQRRGPQTTTSSPILSVPGSLNDENRHTESCQHQEHGRALSEAQERIQRLEDDASTHDRDRASLIAALKKYRADVKDLESLVTKMEDDHSTKVQELKSDHSAALSRLMEEHARTIDNLEAQLAAEIQVRREAEKEVDEVMFRWANQREGSERDMGRLNVRIAKLTDRLKEREITASDLQNHLGAVRERVESFVSSVGGQLLWADIEAGRTIDEPELPDPPKPPRANTEPPSGRPWGLLTPSVEGGRFRDAVDGGSSPILSSDPAVAGSSVAGKVEVGRGKKRCRQNRKDSGIGILMEEDNEQ